MEKLLVQEARLLLEVGLGQGLSALLKQHPACGRERLPLLLATMPHVYEGDGGDAFLLTTLGKLWLAGVAIDWHGYHADETRQRVSLPTYPFEPLRFWVKPGQVTLIANDGGINKPSSAKKADPADWFYEPVWVEMPLESGSETAVNGRWLIFEDELGWGAAMGDQLAAQSVNATQRMQPSDTDTISPRRFYGALKVRHTGSLLFRE